MESSDGQILWSAIKSDAEISNFVLHVTIKCVRYSEITCTGYSSVIFGGNM